MHRDNNTIECTDEQSKAHSWDEAFAAFSEVNAKYDDLIQRHSKAEEAVGAECPREARFFDQYRLGMGMNRERTIDALAWYAQRTGEAIDIATLADEFDAYHERDRAANKRHGVAELDSQIEELRGPWFAAREALMAAPAPDVPALLVKLELAIGSMCEEFGDSVLADAKRLLGTA